MYVLSSDLPQKLERALRDEFLSKCHWEMLLGYIHDDEDSETIYDIIEDEKRHYRELHNLYISLTGRKPEIFQFPKISFSNYVEGITEAMSRKAHLYRFYRDICNTIKSPYLKQLFSKICSEERSHSIKINYMYTRLQCR